MSIKKYSEEELIKIAAEDEINLDVNNEEERTDVHLFVRDLKIKDGLHKVPNEVIYIHYSKKWKPQMPKKNYKLFFRIFSKMFKPLVEPFSRYYLLDRSSFDLGEHTIQEVMRFKKHNFNRDLRENKDKKEEK